MRKFSVVLVGCAIAMVPNLAEARFDERDAERLCRSEAHDAYRASSVEIKDSTRVNNEYLVSGIAERYGDDRVAFLCTVKDARVEKLSPPGRFSNTDHGD